VQIAVGLPMGLAMQASRTSLPSEPELQALLARICLLLAMRRPTALLGTRTSGNAIDRRALGKATSLDASHGGVRVAKPNGLRRHPTAPGIDTTGTITGRLTRQSSRDDSLSLATSPLSPLPSATPATAAATLPTVSVTMSLVGPHTAKQMVALTKPRSMCTSYVALNLPWHAARVVSWLRRSWTLSSRPLPSSSWPNRRRVYAFMAPVVQ